MYYLAIDNGVSGSIASVTDKGIVNYWLMPIRRELNYTKKKAWLNRIDTIKLTDILNPYRDGGAFCLWERPMINPLRWRASVSALRALEATLIVLEGLKIPFRYIDSKEWQRAMLPQGLQKEELKAASDSVAHRLFPTVEFTKNGGGDSLLIAEYARRKDKP